MFKNLSLKTNILIVIAIVAFTVMLMIMLIAETIGRSHILENSFNHLKALREIKANQIENYINTNRNQVATFSQNMMVVDALSSFVSLLVVALLLCSFVTCPPLTFYSLPL